MSITLNLPPEIENALQEVAQATHQMPVDYAAQILVSHLSPIVSLLQREGRTKDLLTGGSHAVAVINLPHALRVSRSIGYEGDEDEAEPAPSTEAPEYVSPNKGFGFLKGSRRAAIQAARGSLRGVVSSDEFLAEKHAEAERERAKDEAINWNGNKS